MGSLILLNCNWKMSEKFCLRWNDFQNNIQSTFQDLRKNEGLKDVTLVCEDSFEIDAHKIVLSSSSLFFQNIFSSKKVNHPIIFMRGVKKTDLVTMLDFMYLGEVNIEQEALQNFLLLANDFNIKGLETKENFTEEESPFIENDFKSKISVNNRAKMITKPSKETRISNVHNATSGDLPSVAASETPYEYHDNVNEVATIKTETENLESIIESMMKKVDGSWTCSQCGKTLGFSGCKNDMRKHIESKHLEGITHPCSYCGKTFRIKQYLQQHISKMHN